MTGFPPLSIPQVGKGVYMQAVRDMVQSKRHRLTIGMDDLRNHNLDLARRCPPADASRLFSPPLPSRAAAFPI